jgi:hypothetical protein
LLDGNWNTAPWTYILLGFAGGWLLIFLAKGVMARLQQRREDYYDCGDRGESRGGDRNE